MRWQENSQLRSNLLQPPNLPLEPLNLPELSFPGFLLQPRIDSSLVRLHGLYHGRVYVAVIFCRKPVLHAVLDRDAIRVAVELLHES